MSTTNNWHTKAIDEVFREVNSRDVGLTLNEAKVRRATYGANVLPEPRPERLISILLRQFQSPLIYILVAASIAVFAMGEVADGAIILAVLAFNAVVGTIQEGKAQNTLRVLRQFTETNATVTRDGAEHIVPDRDVVPGDIILLYEGEKVPADARIISAHNLRVDEAALSGESEPVHKVVELERGGGAPFVRNMVFRGTNVVAGQGRAVVVATGITTKIGALAREIAHIDTEIPLKENIRSLAHLIMAVVLVLSMLIFLTGIMVGKGAGEMFATVVSLAVSIIPEGLPIVMTLVLATGVWRMSKRNVLVKRLHAVESLGQARVIAVDKTGTITRNEMVVQKVFVDGSMYEVGGVGYEPMGDIRKEGTAIDPAQHPDLLRMATSAALLAGAQVVFSDETKRWQVAGDPTEAAMLIFSRKAGIHKDFLEDEMPFVREVLFDYKLKYHYVVRRMDKGETVFIAGAPETILRASSFFWEDGKKVPLVEEKKRSLGDVFLSASREGLRIVAFAEAAGEHELERLTFTGFLGMKDALRAEVPEAMARAHEAGARVVMITGDHRATAEAIAREAGIFREGDLVMTGDEVDAFPDAALAEKLATVSVFARVNPEHKMRIINAFRSRGEIVAMTGDGVNDAPSLVAADLGVAMGRIGTEVAKEASDIVLLDDNFGSIVAAIEEGRSIYKTIKKVILYLFATSLGEVLTIVGALMLGYPLIILPVQIIWLNLVTDGFLDVALAMEPKEKGLLSENFKKPKKYFVDRLMAVRMFVMALPMALGTLALFSYYGFADLARAMTISLTTLAVFQWFNAWNCRSERESLFRMNPFSNKFLIGATIIVIFLQVFALYHPLPQKLLHTVPLSLTEWFIIIPVALTIVLAEEVRKFFSRRLHPVNAL